MACLLRLLFLGVLNLESANARVSGCADQNGGSLYNAWIRLDRAKSWEDVEVVFAIRQTSTQWLREKANTVSDPESPDYGNYMNFDEIAQYVHGHFDSVSAVVNMLSSAGVEREYIHFTLGQDFAIVHIPIGVAEDMFQAEFHYYKHTIKHKLQVIRSDEYAVPDSLVGHVDYVLGVSIHDLPKLPPKDCAPGRKTSAESNKEKHVMGPGNVTPLKIQEVYNLSWYTSSNSHTSQSVVSFHEQYYSSKDLEKFLRQFNLTAGKIDILGYNNMSDPGMEADLDMQYIFSTGQGVSTSFTSVSTSSKSILNDFLTWIVFEVNRTMSPLVHSLSYADIEAMVDPAYINRTEIELMKFALSGRTVLVASADSGVLCDYIKPHSFTPYWPSSSPYVTSVGGTISDVKTVWPGSGGGFSNVIPAPDYQKDTIKMYLNKFKSPNRVYFNPFGRGYPDLSAFAVGCMTINDGEFWPLDGTSCATPIVAGELPI